ncbi:MAG: hypothetical protein NTV93_08070 [Verrucomicrobia bacterium]|nr:hypothetical protein [Verrucomicrobiota bacterium]
MTDDPCNRFDKLGMFRLIADKIARDPGLLQTGLDNIARWTANGADQQHRLRQWEGMIRAAQASKPGMETLLSALREDSEQAAHLREFAPFDGVLTTLERRPFILQCAFQH